MPGLSIVDNGRFYGGVVRAGTSSAFTLAETAYSAGFEVPRHEHRTPFVCVSLGGSFVEEFESDAYDVSAGTVFYHPGEGIHAERFGAGGGRLFVVQIGLDWLRAVAACGVASPGRFVRASDRPAAGLAADAYRAFREDGGASPVILECLLVALLSDLGGERPTREARPPGWLGRVREIVHDRFLDPISLAEIAAEVDVHPSHLARTFVRFHGCSVGEMVRRLRLERAREGLAAPHAELSSVALEAGFADQSHFTRCFKRRFGATPGAYRRALRG